MSTSELSQPTIVGLPRLIRQIAAGAYRIPRFQRPFVWNDDQRLLLLDSIKRGLPIGSILVWETSEHALEEYDRLGPFRLPPTRTSGARSYVIDGHQRFVTLYSALAPTDSTSVESRAEDGTDRVKWPIYYDLAAEEFRLAHKKRTRPEEWMSLPEMMDPSQLYAFQKKLLGKDLKQLAARAEGLAEHFKEYRIPVIPIYTEDLGVVTECFRRVNSSGSSMGEVHLLNAVTWSKEFDLRRRFREIKDGLTPLGWGELDEQILVDVLKLASGLDYYYATPDALRKELEKSPDLLARLPELVRRTAEFLTLRCGVCGPAALPYRVQFVLLCLPTWWRGEASLDGAVGEELERWFWKTTFSESFTGCSNGDIQLAVSHVEAVTNTGAAAPFAYSDNIVPTVRFRANAVRSRAFSLLLTRRTPLDLDCQPIDAARMLAGLGAEAVPKIVPAGDLRDGADGPENRWVVPPHRLKAMRELLGLSLDPRRDEILASHVITPKASNLYARGDLKGFLETRRSDIIDMERRFVDQLDLSYVEGADVLGFEQG